MNPVSVEIVKLANDSVRATVTVSGFALNATHIWLDVPAGLQSGDYAIRAKQGTLRPFSDLTPSEPMMKVIRVLTHDGPPISLPWAWKGELEVVLEAGIG